MSRRVLLLSLLPPLNRTGEVSEGDCFAFASDRVAWPAVLDGDAVPVRVRISGEDDIVIERGVSVRPFNQAPVQKAGVVVLLNGDRALDHLLAIVGRDWRYEIRWCWADEAADNTHGWAACTLWQAGLIDNLSTTDDDRRIVLTLADPLARFDSPAQTEMYPDDFANVAVRGKPMPFALGQVRFVPGVERTTDELSAEAFSYDYHDAAVVGVTDAFDRGDAFTAGVDWDYTPDRRGIQLANKPDRPVCAHVVGAGIPVAQVLVGGSFTTMGGVGRNRIARLNTDGTLDGSFNPGAASTVNAIALQPDGKILVGGAFTTIVSTTRNRIARLNADGTLDGGFNPNANNTVNAIALQPDGKIVVVGSFGSIVSTARNRIARLNTDGTLDGSFNPNAGSIVNAIALQPDGKIVVGGSFTTMGGVGRNFVARLNTDGTLDGGFNPNANNVVSAITIQPDGRILIGGSFTTVGGTTRNRIARLNADGTLDGSFNPNANGAVGAIAIQPDGKILVGGAFTSIVSTARNRIARLNADGTLDGSFNPGAASTVNAIALQPDGKIVVGGGFAVIAGATRSNIARLNADGTIDADFNPAASSTVNVIVLAQGSTPTTRLPEFVRAVVGDRYLPDGSYSDSVDVTAIEAVDASAPYVIGCYYDAPITGLSVLRQALDSWCGWVTSTRDGRLTVGRLVRRPLFPSGPRRRRGQIISARTSIDTAARQSTPLAGLRHHTRHSDSDIATSVDDALRADLKAEYTIKTGATPMPPAYGHATGATPIPTMLQDADQLQGAADYITDLFGGGPCTWYEVDAAISSQIADGLEMGQWIHATHPIEGLDAGRWLCLLGASIRFYRRRATLLLLDIPDAPIPEKK